MIPAASRASAAPVSAGDALAARQPAPATRATDDPALSAGGVADVHPMVDAARIVLEAMLGDAETLAALLDRKHIDHGDMRQAVVGQYQLMADYGARPTDALALVRADLAAAERRAAALRAILTTDHEVQS